MASNRRDAPATEHHLDAAAAGAVEQQAAAAGPLPLPPPPSLSSIPPAPSLMHALTPPISLPAARGRGRGRPRGSLNKRKREGGTGRGGKAQAIGTINLPAPPRAPDIPQSTASDLKFKFESFVPNAAEPPPKKRKTNKDKAGTITVPPPQVQFQASGSAPPFTHIPPPPRIDNIPPPPVHRYVEPQQQQPKPLKQIKAATALPNIDYMHMSIPVSYFDTDRPTSPPPTPTSPTLTAAPLPVPGEGGPSAAELLQGVPIPRYPLSTRPMAVKPPGKLLANTWAANPPLDRTKLPTRKWRQVQREIRGIAGGRWFAKSWAGGERSPLKVGSGSEGLVGSPPPAPPSLGALPLPYNEPSGSATPAAFSLPHTPGVTGMPTGLAALAAAGAAAQHLTVPQDNGYMVVGE